MPCQKIVDKHGTVYRVPAFQPHEKNLKSLEPRPHLDVWWDRDPRPDHRWNEDIIIRQENRTDGADVIIITLGQAYDLLHAVGSLIMDK